MKKIGNWWAENSIEIYELNDGRRVAMNDWNGEEYSDCWETCGENDMKVKKDGLVFKPVYRFEVEDIDLDQIEENSDEWFKAVEVVDFEER